VCFETIEFFQLNTTTHINFIKSREFKRRSKNESFRYSYVYKISIYEYYITDSNYHVSINDSVTT